VLEEEHLSAADERMHGGVERIEVFAKSQAVELLASLVEGLG